ncbi:MAG: hemerythrin domain-containing protein [Rhodobiaceae bacterium]|nr:hemerythrin domain-containing protein [Rhodobiaceae bacterium]MCC0041992.1 hemerythrin domain-containing protein [Rhodobiaceae bacterium]MCC0053394.1 hemerythrin domain-containing protein [Rhodobiaceae bacterium]
MNGRKTDLELRAGLPDHLRELARLFPREGWSAHANFGPLTQFWLERHAVFRKLMAQLHADAHACADREIDPIRYAPRLSRFGGLFVGQLHEHHHVEDDHYFPILAARERALQRGFDLLDADHHAIAGTLDAFTRDANAVLTSAGAPATQGTLPDEAALAGQAARFAETLERFDRLLVRHLEDEEEIIVPVLLKHGEDGFY